MKAAKSARTRASVASPAAASTALMKPHLPAQRKHARTHITHTVSPSPSIPRGMPASRPASTASTHTLSPHHPRPSPSPRVARTARALRLRHAHSAAAHPG